MYQRRSGIANHELGSVSQLAIYLFIFKAALRFALLTVYPKPLFLLLIFHPIMKNWSIFLKIENNLNCRTSLTFQIIISSSLWFFSYSAQPENKIPSAKIQPFMFWRKRDAHTHTCTHTKTHTFFLKPELKHDWKDAIGIL